MKIEDFKCGLLIFSSNFDSGNLASVQEVKTAGAIQKDGGVYEYDYEYNLWTSPDASGTVYENGNRSWFYFNVRGPVSSKFVKFNIMNMNKQFKLFNQGMAPIYKTVPTNNKWKRIKDKPTTEFVNGQFVLSFVHRFSQTTQCTTTYFAFCYPYSYSDCQNDMKTLEDKYFGRQNSAPEDIYFHRDTLCHTNDGLDVDLITISSRKHIQPQHEETLLHLFPDKNRKRALKFQNKKIFFLTSRVHPGETPAAFVFNGFLKFILREDDPRATALRDMFIFKMIPMLNPDGVKRGHYRTDSFGVNLNRMYINPDRLLHPSIYAVKKLMIYYHFSNYSNCNLNHQLKSFHIRTKSDSCKMKTKSNPELCASKKTDLFERSSKLLRRSKTDSNISFLHSSTRRFSHGTFVTPSSTIFNKSNGIPFNVISSGSIMKTSTCTDNSADMKNSTNDFSPQDGNIDIYVDLHGHASKRGCFMYGNYFQNETNLIDCMLFPKLISINSSHFDFQACNFGEKNMYHKDKRDGLSKEGSGRVAMFKSLGIIHSYTMECNYNSGRLTNPIASATCDNGQATPPPLPGFPPKYSQEHYEEVGKGMAIAALDLHQRNPWSRLPLSEHKSLNGVKDWLLKFIRSPAKNTVGLTSKETKNKLTTPKINTKRREEEPTRKVTQLRPSSKQVINFKPVQHVSKSPNVPAKSEDSRMISRKPFLRKQIKKSIPPPTAHRESLGNKVNVGINIDNTSIKIMKNGRFKSSLVFVRKYSLPNVKDLKESQLNSDRKINNNALICNGTKVEKEREVKTADNLHISRKKIVADKRCVKKKTNKTLEITNVSSCHSSSQNTHKPGPSVLDITMITATKQISNPQVDNERIPLQAPYLEET